MFCAFGFLEYYESALTHEKRIAPLVFYPIDLDRELQDGAYSYFIRGRNDDVEINVALKELLRREHALELPNWTALEEEPDPLGLYLSQVEAVIANRPDWKVRRFVTVGLFTFSTLVMYKDLDPEKWPAEDPLHKHSVLRTIIAGSEERGNSVAADYEIDKVLGPEVLLITDADSSQHSAVIDVLKGRNTVIQGPPGTGKSQTITNIISAALDAGKTVLFIAEKMAALEVVKKRLDAAGLGPFCLELHSSKTSKTAVVESLSSRLEYQCTHLPPGRLQSNFDALQSARVELIDYASVANAAAGNTGLTVREILLGSATRETTKEDFPDPIATVRFASPLDLTPHKRKTYFDSAANLERQFLPISTFGPLLNHPWRGLQNCELTDLDVDLLLRSLSDASSALEGLFAAATAIESLAGTTNQRSLTRLTEIVSLWNSMPLPSNFVDDHLLPILRSEKSINSLHKLVTAIKWLSAARPNVTSYITGGEYAVTLSSTSVQATMSLIEGVGASHLNAVELKQRLAELIEYQQSIRKCKIAADKAAGVFGLKVVDLETLAASCSAIRQVCALPAELWPARHKDILSESNRPTIKKAAKSHESLGRRRADLKALWNSSLLPSSAELKTYTIALRTANWFSAIFDPKIRAAKALVKAASTNHKRVLDRESLAREYAQWAQLLDDEVKFTNDSSIATTIGAAFKGMDTDFIALERVSDWAADTRTAMSAYGDLGQRLSEQLFESLANTLRSLARFPRLQNSRIC